MKISCKEIKKYHFNYFIRDKIIVIIDLVILGIFKLSSFGCNYATTCKSYKNGHFFKKSKF